MNSKINRRGFLNHSALASAGAALAASAVQSSRAAGQEPRAQGSLPAGKIGKLTLSRLISGGNLISGWAHSRDLGYVPELMRNYNTDEKVLDTLELLEQHGVNTIIADPRERPMRVFRKFWKERGGKIQWIAEGHPKAEDWKTNIQASIDFGASAVYVQGVIGDRWLKEGHPELLAKCVEFTKSQGVPGGIGAHKLEVIQKA